MSRRFEGFPTLLRILEQNSATGLKYCSICEMSKVIISLLGKLLLSYICTYRRTWLRRKQYRWQSTIFLIREQIKRSFCNLIVKQYNLCNFWKLKVFRKIKQKVHFLIIWIDVKLISGEDYLRSGFVPRWQVLFKSMTGLTQLKIWFKPLMPLNNSRISVSNFPISKSFFLLYTSTQCVLLKPWSLSKTFQLKSWKNSISYLINLSTWKQSLLVFLNSRKVFRVSVLLL